MAKRQRLRPDKSYSQDDLKAAQKVFREFCGDNAVMMEPFAAADLCGKIAQAIATAKAASFDLGHEAARLEAKYGTVVPGIQ